MKKILFSIIVFLSFILIGNAEEKVVVTFSKCVDGDTARFIMEDEEIKVRFLAIDTPESVSTKVEVEAYGKEASDFTCDKITNASKIELEFDPNSDKLDKYDRYLAWIWVDDTLLQDLIISEGLAEVAYLYGDYKYTELLKDHEEIAKSKKIGIWSEEEYNLVNEETKETTEDNEEVKEEKTIKDVIFDYGFYCICILILIILCICSTSFRKKTVNKVKRKIKKELINK